MDREILLNDFAVRSFRDTGDYDYVCARMAYKAQLYPQFLWLGLQAIEKYLKCILLLNRIPATNIFHDLEAALQLLKKHASFEIRLSEASRKFIEDLDTDGRFRYLETSFYGFGLEMLRLDKSVWEIRRYCRVLNYQSTLPDGTEKPMLPIELKEIENSESRPFHKFKIAGGALEKLVADKNHPARKALLWRNFYFGSRARKSVKRPGSFHATNSPLFLHPEILDEVSRYIYLPKDVKAAYRAQLESQSQEDR